MGVTPNANCDVEFKLTIAGGDEHVVSWPSWVVVPPRPPTEATRRLLRDAQGLDVFAPLTPERRAGRGL